MTEFAAVRWPLMAHRVIRCGATVLVAIGLRADIGRIFVRDGSVAFDPMDI
jgi:hypothetical protein